ncbi:NAD-dependent epimerase/dehydratase family protein [Streptomyces sp. NPDC054841]
MTHPRRISAAGEIAAKDPQGRIRVVVDPDPSGPPTALRTANLSWSCVGESATHHIVFQDDVLLADEFFGYVEKAAAAVPGEAVAFYEGWEGRNSGVVRLAGLTGTQWAYAIDEHVPSLALMLPAEVARGYEKFAARHGDGWPYDVVIQRYLKALGMPVRLAVPCTVDHDDVPSLAGNSKHGWRRATLFSQKAVEVTSYDCASFDVVPFFQYGEARSAVRLGGRWECLDTDRYLRRIGLAERCDTDFAAAGQPGLPEAVRRQVWLTAFATGSVYAGLTPRDPDPETAAAVMDSLGPGGLCEEYTGAELLSMIPEVRELALAAFESGRAARPDRGETVSPKAAGVLVTGGGEAFGEQLARLLTDAGCGAQYVGRLSAGARSGVDAVIHLGDPDGGVGPVTDMLADAGKLSVRRLIHVSSAAVYRGAGGAACAEDALSARPDDARAGAWWDGEEACRRWGAQTGTPVQVVRLAEQVGPHAPLRGVLATWMLQAWTRRPMTLIEGRLHQVADHRDLADALAAVLAGPVRAPIYNVASERYDENEFAELAAETARRTPWERATGADGPYTPLMTTALITADTDWRPSAPVRNGARAQAQWLACDTHDDIPGVTGVPRGDADA